MSLPKEKSKVLQDVDSMIEFSESLPRAPKCSSCCTIDGYSIITSNIYYISNIEKCSLMGALQAGYITQKEYEYAIEGKKGLNKIEVDKSWYLSLRPLQDL